MINYPYKTQINFSLSIGFAGAVQRQSFSPKDYPSYSEEEWSALSDSDREKWVETEAKEWAYEHVELSWEIQK